MDAVTARLCRRLSLTHKGFASSLGPPVAIERKGDDEYAGWTNDVIIRASVFGFGLAIIASIASPAEAKVGATQGYGALLCKTLLKNWKFDSPSAFIFGQGSMDAYNKLRYVEGKSVIDLNPDDFPVPLQMIFIRQYCTNNPDQEVAAAFYDLYKEMAQHHGVTFP